jgi:two-component system KDP operon response regulator KdpE
MVAPASPVLVVEDEADMAQSYERLLRRAGCRVVHADSRAGALLALAREAPRLVIADRGLPDGDGLDVVRAARRLDPPAPVIVVTGSGAPAAHRAAREAGAQAVLAKPFAVGALLALVQGALAARAAPSVAFAGTEPMQIPHARRPTGREEGP